jgi:Fe-S cluster assembly ATP-binding protein
MILEIVNLHVAIEDKEIIKGLNLKIKDNEFHVLMGPNGSGKTTLGKTIMGHPKLKITQGEILVDGKSILGLKADKRAKLGLFLQFQNPIEIEGVGFVNFLNAASGALHGPSDVKTFLKEIKENSAKLNIEENMSKRQLNQGFSGGEKKKAEILQMSILKPKLAILDEPDSGLDIDSIKIVANNINEIAKMNNMGLLVITHYSRILNYMNPQFVHIIIDGKIVAEGGTELIKELEEEGYDRFVKQ